MVYIQTHIHNYSSHIQIVLFPEKPIFITYIINFTVVEEAVVATLLR